MNNHNKMGATITLIHEVYCAFGAFIPAKIEKDLFSRNSKRLALAFDWLLVS